MPRKASRSIAIKVKKGEKNTDIHDDNDQCKEKVKAKEVKDDVLSSSPKKDADAGDASPESKQQSFIEEEVTITEIEASAAKSESDVSVTKMKKARTKKQSQSLKIIKGKQTKILIADESCDTNEKEAVDKGSSTVEAVPIKETPKRKSFFNLGKKSTSKTPKAEVESDESGMKYVKTKKSVRNRLLTDFFPVRRSDRRSKAELEKIETEKLHEKILSGCEDDLKVVEIEGKGRGVIGTKVFKRSDFIVQYSGDLITLTEAQAKEDKYSKNPDTGCYMYYFKFKNKNYCVDATAESGKLGRLLNHSKNGNCRTKVIGIGDRPYLILVAARDIEKNEELLYDYGDRSKEAIEAHPWLAL